MHKRAAIGSTVVDLFADPRIGTATIYAVARKALVPGILALATAALLAGCASVLDTDNALAVTPYELQDGERIVIDVFVNDQGPYKFLLDTGASISVIFDRLRDKLGLHSIPGREVIVHGIVASGQFSLLEVDRLGVGGEVWSKPRIVSLPDETAASAYLDGVLGVDFLRRYAIGLSARERVLRLYPPDFLAQRDYWGWTAIPLREQALHQGAVSAYFVDIEIEDQVLPAALDLGAGLNLINIPGAQSLKLVQRRPRAEDEVTGLLQSLPAASRFVARQVTTSGVQWRNEVFLVADVGIFETFGLAGRPGAILGAGFFSQRDFMIDFVDNRLLVRVAMNEVEVPEVGE